jgi:hypothetical protein
MYKLEDYETVAMLNRWFVENYPMGRTNIVITYHDVEKGIITCRAEVYRDANDAYPATSNIAHGVRDLYNSNMLTVRNFRALNQPIKHELDLCPLMYAIKAEYLPQYWDPYTQEPLGYFSIACGHAEIKLYR